MQFKIAAFAALASSVAAQSIPASEEVSILSVLRTALPSSLLQEAITNAAAVSSQLVSEFSAGETPSWYSALPSDIKTILQPSAVLATTTALANVTSAIGNGTVLPTGTGGLLNTTALVNGTGRSTSFQSASRLTTTTGSTRSSSNTANGAGFQSSSSSSSSTGGAAMPTAIFGMGLAGAAGLMGVLVL